jgi:hypothetical protein
MADEGDDRSRSVVLWVESGQARGLFATPVEFVPLLADDLSFDGVVIAAAFCPPNMLSCRPRIGHFSPLCLCRGFNE